MSKDSSGCGCYAWLIILFINLTIGGISVNYLTNSLFSKNLPFWADALIGLFGGEIAIPAAIIVWILRICGVDVQLN